MTPVLPRQFGRSFAKFAPCSVSYDLRGSVFSIPGQKTGNLRNVRGHREGSNVRAKSREESSFPQMLQKAREVEAILRSVCNPEALSTDRLQPFGERGKQGWHRRGIVGTVHH